MKRLFIPLILILVLSACGPSVVETPNPANVEDCPNFVQDGNFAFATIGAEFQPGDTVSWNETTVEPGQVYFYGLRTGMNLIGFELAPDVNFEFTEGLEIVEYHSFRDTRWFMVTVPEGLASAPGIKFSRTSP